MADFSVIKFCSLYDSDAAVTLVEDSGRAIVFEKNEVNVRVLHSRPEDPEAKFLFTCHGVLGTVTFLGRRYLLVVSEARKVGRLLLEHDVYAVGSQCIIPLFHPIRLSSRERDFIRVFKQFDISNNFYFSYSYNLCNSLQLNLSYRSVLADPAGDCAWMPFDPGLTEQKYCFNFGHKLDLCGVDDRLFGLTLFVVHGYFSESVLNVSGRNLTFTLISRRSRFYAGTRYRKRGITGAGHVANDVETEQILHDWAMTRAVSAFVLVRGSTPIFWAQDPNESFLKKPPIVYSHSDPTNASLRTHFRELLSLYGGPLVVLNLLSDNPATEEGQLSERYERMIEELNAELPSFLKVLYFAKNIKALLERGVAKQALKEVVDTVLERIGLTFVPGFPLADGRPQTPAWEAGGGGPGGPPPPLSVQTGVARVSCLDCLDRTSAFSKHLSLRVFRRQLELIGINANYELSTYFISNFIPSALNTDRLEARERAGGSTPSEALEGPATPASDRDIVVSDYFGFNYVKGLMFEVVKDRYEEMCDELSMQYAGSKALRKYEGQSRALSISLELFTTVRRRYRNYFEDTRIQEQTNFFLCADALSRFSALGVDIVGDLDDALHFEPIPVEFATVDAFVLALVVFAKRGRALSARCDTQFEGADALDAGFDYRVHAECLGLGAGLACPADPECPVHRAACERAGALKAVLAGYLTLEPQPCDGYTDLTRYKPATRPIRMLNTGADSPPDSGRQGSGGAAHSPAAAAPGAETVAIANNAADFERFLVPAYTPDPGQWSLEPRPRTESLRRFVEVAI